MVPGSTFFGHFGDISGMLNLPGTVLVVTSNPARNLRARASHSPSIRLGRGTSPFICSNQVAPVINLPRLTGSPLHAQRLVEQLGPPRPALVIVNGRDAVASTKAFVTALLDGLLTWHPKSTVVLSMCPPEVQRWAREAALASGDFERLIS